MDVRLLIATWPQDSPRGSVSRFCAEHSISRSQFYEIRQRARTEGVVEALAVRSRKPRTNPNAVSVEIEDVAVRLRKELDDDGWDCGPISVRHEMLLLGLPAPAPATLARIFTRRGMVEPQPQKRPRSAMRFFTFPAPNACWQIDATDWPLRDGSPGVVFQVLDDHSRRILASLTATGETSEAACLVVAAAIGRFGPPQLFLSDNGAALNPTRRGYAGKLETWLRSLGVKPITSRPFHPQTCGKNERVHLTLKRYLRARPTATTLVELQAQVDAFDEHYNTRRPHQSLGGQTPLQAWQATPAAEPPTPPAPHAPPAHPAPRPPRRPRLTVTQPKVAPNGTATVANRRIQLGWEHAGNTILALRNGQHIDIFDSHGNHIRSLDLEPGRNYYGSGRPQGGTLAMRRSAGLKTPRPPSGMS